MNVNYFYRLRMIMKLLFQTEFEGDIENEEEEEDRWGELCIRYDQEAQFLTGRPDYENIVSNGLW